jgi:hypothetical protein
MKKLLLSIFLLFIAVPATAGQVLPSLYAREYCSMRSLGVSKDEAMSSAISTSYVSSLPDLPQVTIGGATYDTDVIQAFRAVQDRCPQYLN